MQADDPMEVENGSCRSEEDTPLGFADKVFSSILLLSLPKYFNFNLTMF